MDRSPATPSTPAPAIGFIGLGLMGAPIALRLHQAFGGLATIARHRAQAQAQTPAYAVLSDAAALAAACDLVFTCLPAPAASRTVYLAPDGLVAHARPGALLVELSTIEPQTAQQIGAACAARGLGFLDAPVSGGPGGARAGTLSVMAGGSEADYARALPLFESFAKKCFHLGAVGTGTTAKLCNQMIVSVTNALVAESMVMARKAGLDTERLYEVLRASSAHSNTLDRAVPNFILPGKFDAAFALDGIYKDLECVTQTGKQLGVRLLLAATAQQLYEEARAAGHGDKDAAGVYLSIERAAGLPARG